MGISDSNLQKKGCVISLAGAYDSFLCLIALTFLFVWGCWKVCVSSFGIAPGRFSANSSTKE